MKEFAKTRIITIFVANKTMKMEIEIENHPLQPFLPVKARLLMLGSFPPQKKRWSMDFYYPNLNNDMWRITGILFFNNKDYFLNESKKPFAESASSTFLMRKGLHFLIRLLPYAACKIMLPTNSWKLCNLPISAHCSCNFRNAKRSSLPARKPRTPSVRNSV